MNLKENFKKGTLLISGILILLTMPLITVISYSCISSSSIEDSIVQVWKPANALGQESTLLSFGVAVGDGSQVLTVINYTEDIPDILELVKPGEDTYQASIEAIDPRNSITLLRLEGVKHPPARIAGTVPVVLEDEVIVHGWPGPEYDILEKRSASFPGYGEIFVIDITQGPYIAGDGAVVTDKSGAVIGLIGTLYNTFSYRLGPIGMTAPIIDIQTALELLSPDATNQPWVNGPVDSYITSDETMSGEMPTWPPPEQYNEMTSAIRVLLGTMGEPLPENEIISDYHQISFPGYDVADNSTLLSVLFPYPVELKNTAGQVVAKAKWVGIQWGCSNDKTNRLFYGIIENNWKPITEGGFFLLGDITALEDVLSHSKPTGIIHSTFPSRSHDGSTYVVKNYPNSYLPTIA